MQEFQFSISLAFSFLPSFLNAHVSHTHIVFGVFLFGLVRLAFGVFLCVEYRLLCVMTLLCNVELIMFHEVLLADYFEAVRFRRFYLYFLIRKNAGTVM